VSKDFFNDGLELVLHLLVGSVDANVLDDTAKHEVDVRRLHPRNQKKKKKKNALGK